MTSERAVPTAAERLAAELSWLDKCPGQSFSFNDFSVLRPAAREVLAALDAAEAKYRAEHLKVFANLARAHKAEAEVRRLEVVVAQFRAAETWEEIAAAEKALSGPAIPVPADDTACACGVSAEHGPHEEELPARVQLEDGSMVMPWQLPRAEQVRLGYVAPVATPEETRGPLCVCHESGEAPCDDYAAPGSDRCRHCQRYCVPVTTPEETEHAFKPRNPGSSLCVCGVGESVHYHFEAPVAAADKEGTE